MRGKEGEGLSRNLYNGPMDKDNGVVRLSVGDGGGYGRGRVMGENRDNYN